MRLHFGLLAVFVTAVVSALAASSTVEVVNHHPFSVRQPFSVAGSTVVAEVGARSSVLVSTAAKPRTALLSATPQGGGTGTHVAGRTFGTHELGICSSRRRTVKPSTTRAGSRHCPCNSNRWRTRRSMPTGRPRGRKKAFRSPSQPRVFRDGFFDTEISLQNVSSDAPVEFTWRPSPVGSIRRPARTLLCYDNRMGGFRRTGPHSLQRRGGPSLVPAARNRLARIELRKQLRNHSEQLFRKSDSAR